VGVVNALRAVAADARLFDANGKPAVVTYVSESAVNLRSPGNSWVMLCDARLGCGPRTVLVEAHRALARSVSVGDTVTVGKTSVVGDAGEIVTWEHATRWRPSPPLGAGDGLGTRLSIAADIVSRHGCFLARPLISGPVLALRDGCLRANPTAIQRAVADLAGLGPGLTPAGDDYLAGYLAALLHLATDSPAALTARTLLRAAVNTIEPGSTHPLSQFLLAEYTAGMIPQFLDECLRALLRPSTTQRLNARVRRVLRHGATSGTEMMLGILDAGADFRIGSHPQRTDTGRSRPETPTRRPGSVEALWHSTERIHP
jgi:hypothetical protein